MADREEWKLHASPLLRCVPGGEHDGSLSCQQPESKGLLEIQFNDCTGMALVTDRDVLTVIQLKITTAGRHDEPAFNGRRPNNSSVHHSLNMVQDRIPLVASPADGSVRLC